MPRERVDHGPRFAEQETYGQYRVEVATGYDGTTDSWPFHAYRIDVYGNRVPLLRGVERTRENAFERGFAEAMQAIDADRATSVDAVQLKVRDY